MSINFEFDRTENGETVRVSKSEGMQEINAAMMGPGKKAVRQMSSGYTKHRIAYRDGRDVTLVRVEVTDEPAAEWNGTASRATHFHKFDRFLTARCNSRIAARNSRRLNGVLVGFEDLRTRAEAEEFSTATFCPRCESM